MKHVWMMALALGLVLGAPGTALAAAEPQCALEYDAQTRALVLRYAGTDVAFDTQDTGEAIQVAVDFTGPVSLRAGRSMAQIAGFASWRQEGAQLVITYKKPYNVVVEDNPHTHTARLVNLVAPTTMPAVRPIVAPVLLAATPAPVAVAEAAGTTTFSVAGRLPLVPVPAVDAPGETPAPAINVRVAPNFVPPSAAIVPVAPAPSPEVVPARYPEPLPTALPVPVALPSLMPAALPSTATGWSLGGLRHGQGLAVAPSFAYTNYDEAYPAGDVAVQAASVLMPGLSLEGRGRLPVGPEWLRPNWFGTGRLDVANYAFRDELFPLSTHSRQTWRGELTAGRRLAWYDLQLDAGLGYMLRWESTLHSAVSPEPSYAFASGRLLHGPELTLAGAWRPSQPGFLADWGLTADVGYSPYVFSRVDGGAGPLPSLMGLQLNAGIERWFGDHCVRLGYQRWSLGSGGQYDEIFQGPFISVH